MWAYRIAESFFQLSKLERIRRHIYSTRDDARGDVVDYIEMIYNSERRHGFSDQLPPEECEKRFTERLVGVWDGGSDSPDHHRLPIPLSVGL